MTEEEKRRRLLVVEAQMRLDARDKVTVARCVMQPNGVLLLDSFVNPDHWLETVRMNYDKDRAHHCKIVDVEIRIREAKS